LKTQVKPLIIIVNVIIIAMSRRPLAVGEVHTWVSKNWFTTQYFNILQNKSSIGIK